MKTALGSVGARQSTILRLPKLPGRWKATTLGRVFSIQLGKMLCPQPKSPTDRLLPYFCAADVHFSGVSTDDLKKMWFGEEEVELFRVQNGDFVVVEGGAGAGGCAIVANLECEVFMQNSILRLRPKQQVESRFFCHWLESRVRRGYVDCVCNKATIPHFTKEKVARVPIPLPPLPEQRAIVAFLDGKCARLDALVEAKTREMALLKELRERIIADAVTKGVGDGNKPLKPSGIFWQPQMPAHWRTERLKHILQKLDRPLPETPELLICTNKGKVVQRGDSKMGLVSDDISIYQGVKPGDLLIHGMDTWHGAVAVSEEEGMCTPVVHVCQSDEDCRFIAYYLQNMARDKVFKLISNGVRQNTSDFRAWNKVGDIPIPLPPLPEQHRIVEFIEENTAKIDALVEKLEEEIARLKEYRERLVADTVTGARRVEAEG